MEEALRALAEAARASAPGSSSSRCASRSPGSRVSPGIFDVLVLLGRERSLRRLDAARSRRLIAARGRVTADAI